jgi:hypothetical protein
MSVLEFCQWIEATAVGVWVRESLYGFQILTATHIVGVALSVGAFAWFDFRLLGIALQRVPVASVYRRIIPIATAGFIVAFISGGLLFIGYAVPAYHNLAFRLKLTAMALAGLNALAYHFVTERGIVTWNTSPSPPTAAKLAGVFSLALWTSVILGGRMVAYTIFNAPF